MSNKPSTFLSKYKQASGGYGSGLVPLLEHGEKLVIESDVVAKYIAQNIPHANGKKDYLYPDSDIQACHLIDSFLSKWYLATDRYYDLLCARSMNEVKTTKLDFFNALKSLEDILNNEMIDEYQGGPFLLGKHFSLAECISAPWVQRFFVTLPYFRDIDVDSELKSMNRLSTWMNATRERPSVVASKCPTDEMIAAAKRYYVSFITPGAKGRL